ACRVDGRLASVRRVAIAVAEACAARGLACAAYAARRPVGVGARVAAEAAVRGRRVQVRLAAVARVAVAVTRAGSARRCSANASRADRAAAVDGTRAATDAAVNRVGLE